MVETSLKFEKIHEDYRGEIYLVLDVLKEGRELTLFTTKKRYARGGCIHRLNGEYCVVIKGKIKYLIGDKPPLILSEGETCYIEPGTPHFFISLSDDCVVMEWGAMPEEKKERDPDARAIVEHINLSRKKRRIY